MRIVRDPNVVGSEQGPPARAERNDYCAVMAELECLVQLLVKNGSLRSLTHGSCSVPHVTCPCPLGNVKNRKSEDHGPGFSPSTASRRSQTCGLR